MTAVEMTAPAAGMAPAMAAAARPVALAEEDSWEAPGALVADQMVAAEGGAGV
jgi:hypothetical protein